LHGDAHLIGRFLNAAFENIGNTKLLRDVAQIGERAFVFLCRCARDDFQSGDFRLSGQNLVLNALGKEAVVLIRT